MMKWEEKKRERRKDADWDNNTEKKNRRYQVMWFSSNNIQIHRQSACDFCVKIQRSNILNALRLQNTTSHIYYIFVIIFVYIYYSQYFCDYRFVFRLDAKLCRHAYIWFILLYYFMISLNISYFRFIFFFFHRLSSSYIFLNSLLSCNCHIGIKFLNIICLQSLLKHTIIMMVIIKNV